MDKPCRNYHLSEAGRRKLRRTIRRTKPWLRSTGPRTEAGKLRSAANAIFSLEHTKNPWIVTDTTTAMILMVQAYIAYQRAVLDSIMRRGDRWVERMFDMAKWTYRLVDLGDVDTGLGRKLLDSLERWWEEVRRVTPITCSLRDLVLPDLGGETR